MNFFLHLPEILAKNALSLVLAEKAAKLGAAARVSNEQVQAEYLAALALVQASLLTPQTVVFLSFRS